MSKAPSREQFLEDYMSGMKWSDMAAKYGYTSSAYLRRLKRRWEIPSRRVYLKPDRDTLYDQVVNQGIPIKELTELYGYSDVSNLYAWCRQWGIPTVWEHPTDYLRRQDLSADQHAIVVGTLMGDGYVSPLSPRRNCQMTLAQSERHLEYLEWIADQLRPFVQWEHPYRQAQQGFGLGNFLYSYKTIFHPTFTAYRHLFYDGGRKVITPEALSRLTPLSLAIWIMDDGSFHYTRDYITLCTNQFTYDEHVLMQSYFTDRWNITGQIHKVKRGRQFTLVFNRENSRILIGLVRDFIIPSMLYKIGIKS